MSTIAQAPRPHTGTALVPVYHPEYEGDRDLVGTAIAAMETVPTRPAPAVKTQTITDLATACGYPPIDSDVPVYRMRLTGKVHGLVFTREGRQGLVIDADVTDFAAYLIALKLLGEIENAPAGTDANGRATLIGGLVVDSVDEIPDPRIGEPGRPCTDRQPWQRLGLAYCTGAHAPWEHPEDRTHFGVSEYVDLTLAEPFELLDGTHVVGRAEMYIQQEDTDAAPHIRLGMEDDGHQLVMTPAQTRQVGLKLLALADKAEGIHPGEGA